MVLAILDQGHASDITTYRADIPHDCGKSSKSWAQAYLYAVAQTGGAGVGFGSDFNGFAGEPAPRFGPDACDGDQQAAQTGGVGYPFSVIGGNGQTMEWRNRV
jgi:microsomal dipeptidase-like Zn-dependent dipeptidase